MRFAMDGMVCRSESDAIPDELVLAAALALPLLATSKAGGICTVLGRSLPLLVMLGVPMSRERRSLVWASIRWRANSVGMGDVNVNQVG